MQLFVLVFATICICICYYLSVSGYFQQNSKIALVAGGCSYFRHPCISSVPSCCSYLAPLDSKTKLSPIFSSLFGKKHTCVCDDLRIYSCKNLPKAAELFQHIPPGISLHMDLLNFKSFWHLQCLIMNDKTLCT